MIKYILLKMFERHIICSINIQMKVRSEDRSEEKNEGRESPRYALVCSVAGVLVNVILDYIFLFP